MQPEERDAAYLWDMLDAAKAVREFVSSRTYDDYQKDRMLRGAVERHIEIIGEAANQGAVFVLHVFQKKSKSGIATPKPDIDIIRERLKVAEKFSREMRDE